MKPPKWRSSTQCAAVRTTRGAITVPVQAKPRSLLVRAAMKASEGKSAIAATSPRMIEACAPVAAGAAEAGGEDGEQRADGRQRGRRSSP